MEEVIRQNAELKDAMTQMMGMFQQLKEDVDVLKTARSADSGSRGDIDNSSRGLEGETASRGDEREPRGRSRSGSRTSRRPRYGRSRSRSSRHESRPQRTGHRDTSLSRSRSRSPIRRSWADIMSDLDDQEQESSYQATGATLVTVSEGTASTLDKYFTKPMRNPERLQLRNTYGLPKVTSTKTPQLETFLKEEIPANAKAADRDLARIHSHLLDAVAPPHGSYGQKGHGV